MENTKHYPTHPGAEHPPIMTCEIPLEEYESLKRENAELKKGAKNLILDNYLQDKEIRHQKYKRCFAMAKVCKLKRYDAADYRIPRRKWDFYDKWLKRWLELAEMFK